MKGELKLPGMLSIKDMKPDHMLKPTTIDLALAHKPDGESVVLFRVETIDGSYGWITYADDFSRFADMVNEIRDSMSDKSA